MNWGLFFGTVTWIVGVVSAIATLWAIVDLLNEHTPDDARTFARNAFFIALPVLTLSIATIVGMGWFS